MLQKMTRFQKAIRNNGLTLVLLLLFILTICGQFITGYKSYNEERLEENQQPISWTSYVTTGHFISSVGENWESEFFQMALFVWLTACLYQRGSAESNKLPEEKTAKDLQDEEAERTFNAESRKSNRWWRLYEHSLTISLAILFLLSFFIHAVGSTDLINEQRTRVGLASIGFWDVFKENEFWFESFQNWQSEFLSVAAIVVLSIFLRQKGSAQSKKMNVSNARTEG